MVRYIVAAAVTLSMLVFAMSAGAGSAPQQNMGAGEMKLDGGTRGLVPFPHLRHQQTLDDCQVCHSTFPQEKGSIQKAIDEGKLAQKQVMTKLCIQCHRMKKKAGINSGPTTCSKCHVKE